MKNLKALREARGISQQKLADQIGTNQQNIHRYEHGFYEPDIRTLTQLAEFFDTSIDYLVGATSFNHKIEPVNAHELNDEESSILEQLRQLSPRQRQGLALFLNTLLDKTSES
ncbi:MAG: helix-turn-helix transcriptional regulator [Clostridiales bacterium]|nr:helix-turn-helix transcriptional regulator [Clostridiales bacterium]